MPYLSRLIARRRAVLVLATLAILPHLQGQTSAEGRTTPTFANSPALRNFSQIPLAFEKIPNERAGQFVAHGEGYSVVLEPRIPSMRIVSDEDHGASPMLLEFSGARFSNPVASEELPGKVNYIKGNDPAGWLTGLSTYRRVTYPDAYRGVDLRFYGTQNHLEFDLVVKPGADPRQIRMRVRGDQKLSLDSAGALHLGKSAFRIELPRIYEQDADGNRKTIAGRFALREQNEVAFEMGTYDRSRSLVIDPTIVYSTLVGGTLSSTFPNGGIAVDAVGNVTIAGYTFAADFPLANAVQGQFKSSPQVFVSKINAAGTALIYSTYIGGSSYQYAYKVAADANGAAWITGLTSSSDFPAVNAAQPIFGGSYDAFVVKLGASGALQFSTFLGGSSYDSGYAIAVDGAGNGYVTGYTGLPFPTTSGTLQPAGLFAKAFVTKYSSTGSICQYRLKIPHSAG